MPIGEQSFFQRASSNWRHISRRTAAIGFAVSALGASIDVVSWSRGGDLGPLGWTQAGLQVALVFGAIYLAASDILGRTATLFGGVRFIAAAVALLLPIAITFGILLLIRPLLSEGWRAAFLLGGLFVSGAVIVLLPAWPLAQSMQTTLVSPMAAFRDTRGHRGSLVLISFALGAINKADFIPKMQTANNVGEVALIAGGQTLMGLVSIAFTASIAATAWQFAARRRLMATS